MPRSLWIEEGYTEKHDGCLSRLRDALIALVVTALFILLIRLSH